MAYKAPTMTKGILPEATAVMSAQEWGDRAWKVLKDMARRRRKPFTSEDLTARVGRPAHPNAIGALFRRGSNAGIIVTVGFVPSSRESRRKAPIRQWTGV